MAGGDCEEKWQGEMTIGGKEIAVQENAASNVDGRW